MTVQKFKIWLFSTGQVGITLNTDWQVPKNLENPLDLEASNRAIHFMLGWFLNPVMKGDYPKIVRDQVDRKSQEQGLPGSRLPRFTETEKSYIKGSQTVYLEYL